MSKRISAILSAISISVLVTACTPSTPSTGGDQSSSAATMEGSSSSQLIMEPGADGQEDTGASASEMSEKSEPAGDDGAAASAGVDVKVGVAVSARVIPLTTSNFLFTPSAITVKKGEKITLRLTGKEGNHGFAIESLGINTAVSEGKTVDVELPTDKTGTFSFRCSVPCGPGHRDMTGTVTITE